MIGILSPPKLEIIFITTPYFIDRRDYSNYRLLIIVIKFKRKHELTIYVDLYDYKY